MGIMHLGLNAAEKEAATTEQSVIPCVLLCHIQTCMASLSSVVSAASLAVSHSL